MRPKSSHEWKVPNDPKLWIKWAHARDKLTNEQVYWVSTSSREGKPHSAPVSGIWKSDAFYFETEPSSVKGRNLSENPGIVVHLQDGLDTVIVEGHAERYLDLEGMKKLKRDFVRKYEYTPDWSDETRQIVYRVAPRVAHAWRTPKMHRNMVNFLF